MGGCLDFNGNNDKNKEQKGLASITDPTKIKQQKRREYGEEGDCYCGIVPSVGPLNNGENGSFINPMIVKNPNEVCDYIANKTEKWEAGLIVYWSTVALTAAQKNLRKTLSQARSDQRRYLSQYKQKEAEKLKIKPRYTCKTCKSVFDSTRIYEKHSSFYCPIRSCGVCLINTPVVPKKIQKQISRCTTSYIEKTTAREKKRKKTYDENTNPKKKAFKESISGVSYGGIAAC